MSKTLLHFLTKPFTETQPRRHTASGSRVSARTATRLRTPLCSLLVYRLLLQLQAAPSACVVYVVVGARLPASTLLPCTRTLPAQPVGRRHGLPVSPPRSEPALVPPHSVQRVLVPRLVKVLPGAGVRRVETRPVRPRACQQGRLAGRWEVVQHEALMRRNGN